MKIKVVPLLWVVSWLIFIASTYEAGVVKPALPGHLRVHIGVSDNSNYIEDWVKKPSADDVRIKSVDHFTFGQVMHVAFIITGYTLDKELKMDVTVGYKVVAPDGATVFDEPHYAQAKGDVKFKQGFIMADPAAEIMFDDEEPTGRYKIQVIVRDNISRRTTQEEAEFSIHPWDQELVKNQTENYSISKANQLFQTGNYERAAWQAMSLYPVDKKAALKIGWALKGKVALPIQDYLFKIFQKSLQNDPSLRLHGKNSLVRDWLHQKSAWCDLFIRNVQRENIENGVKPLIVS